MTIPSPRRGRWRHPMPSISAIITWWWPIVSMAGVVINGQEHPAKIEPHMHTGIGLSPVRLGCCCNQDKDHEAASNDHFTFHFRSPF